MKAPVKGTVNEITIQGRLGRDPELKHVGQKQTALCQFSLATQENIGQGETRTHWIDVKVWGKLAEAIAEKLQKGDVVLVAGELTQETWTDKETGSERKRYVVRASNAWKPIWPKRRAEKTEDAEAGDDGDVEF